MNEAVARKTKKGLFLRSIESISMQVSRFLLQMILARILMPEDFGVIAIMTTFTTLANTMVNNGLGSALLQRKEFKQSDISTVFFVELSVGVLSYIVLFSIAPLVASFYENPMITEYLRVFAISVVLGSLSSIQLTVGRHRLDFMPSLVSNIAAVVAQTAVGIYMALTGYGVWSLIVSQVTGYAVRAILLISLTRWFPNLCFDIQSLKQMFGYSWKLFAGWLIGTLYHDAFSWIIGKVYDSKTLGYYSKGNSIPSIINKVVTQVTTAVMFPAIAKSQDDSQLVKQQTRQMLSVTAAMILPVMAGLAGAAESLVSVVLTEKWLGAVPVIQIMCIPLSLNVISNANMQTFNAIGRSDLFLKMEMIKRGLTIALVFICINIDYYVMLFSIGFGGLLSLIVNAVFNKKLLNYNAKEYASDLLPYTLCAIGLFLGVNAINLLPCHVGLCLALQLAVCFVVYFGLIFSGVLPAFKAIRSTLLSILKRKA